MQRLLEVYEVPTNEGNERYQNAADRVVGRDKRPMRLRYRGKGQAAKRQPS